MVAPGFGEFFPKTTGSLYLAVIAAARALVVVVPGVRCTNLLAVLGLVGDAELDEKPGKVAADPGSPAVRVIGSVFSHHMLPNGSAAQLRAPAPK